MLSAPAAVTVMAAASAAAERAFGSKAPAPPARPATFAYTPLFAESSQAGGLVRPRGGAARNGRHVRVWPKPAGGWKFVSAQLPPSLDDEPLAATADSGEARRMSASGRTRPTGLRPLAGEAAAAAARSFAARGFSDPRLIRHWTDIAGAETARLARPERLSLPKGQTSGGTLTLRTPPGAALLLQHQSPELIARINAAFGRPLVAQLRFVQGERAPALPPVEGPAPIPDVTDSGLGLADDGLRAVVARLQARLAQTPGDQR